MPAQFTPDVISISIAGLSGPYRLESLATTVGMRPGTANILMPDAGLNGAYANSIKGAIGTIYINGVLKFTGHVYGTRKRLSDQSVSVTLLDKRALLNKTWVGARHLTTNGLPVLGPEIIFNYQNKPNRSNDVLAGGGYDFIYEKGDVDDEPVCSVFEAQFWTYGDILAWLWRKYVDDLNTPNIPAAGGMEEIAGQMNLFGAPVGVAIDEVFNHTNCAWSLDGAGIPYIFTRVTPKTSTTIQFLDNNTFRSPDAYTLDFPCEFDVDWDASEVVGAVDVVGGRELREVMLAGDTLDGNGNITTPSPDWDGPYANFSDTYMSQEEGVDGVVYNDYWRFKRNRFEAHGAGKNIREKDRGINKVFMSQLLLRRDKDGLWIVNPEEAECGVVGAGSVIVKEPPRSVEKPFQDSFDFGRGHYITGPFHPGDGIEHGPPRKFVAPIICETRKSAEASNPLSGLPAVTRRAVIREDIEHQSREFIQVPGEWDQDAGDYIYEDFAAGVVYDGQTPLDDIAARIEPEIGRPVVSVRGEFPSYRLLEVGTRLQANGGHFDLTGDEIVVATVYRGDRQSLEFYATNYIGSGLGAIVTQFIDERMYRR
jgi:hypothetical protein